MQFGVDDHVGTLRFAHPRKMRKIRISTASEHDTRHFESVLDPVNTSADVYADKGYVDKAREARLTRQGHRLHIQRKAKAGQPLSTCQKRRNTRIRARVEHPFAALIQMGGKTLRTIGLTRADFQLHGKAACYHLRRLLSLKTFGNSNFRAKIRQKSLSIGD